MRRKQLGITPPRNGAPLKCAKIELGTKTGPMDCAAPLATVEKKPIKAKQNRDLPTVRSLKLRLLPYQFVAGACFFYSVVQTLHASVVTSPWTTHRSGQKPLPCIPKRVGFQLRSLY